MERVTFYSLNDGLRGIDIARRVCSVVCYDVAKDFPFGTIWNERGLSIVCYTFIPEIRRIGIDRFDAFGSRL
jgi:hypothetical protein